MSWRFIYVKECEDLSVKLDNLLVIKDGEEYPIPLEDINTIMLESNRSTITTKLLVKLSEYKISLVVCDDKMLPTGIMLPFNKQHRSSKIAYNQIGLASEDRDDIWSEIIKFKIYNQKEVLRILERNKEAINKLEGYINEIKIGDSTNREGHAAKVYFNNLFGDNFTRHNEDVRNHGLNYGYSILRSNIARVVVMAGLIPNIGIHHRSELNNFNLVDDLIEPFRPIVDFIVASKFDNKEFLERRDKLRLINLLNGTIEVNGTRSTVAGSIEKFVYEIINSVETGKKDKLSIPLCATFKEYEL